MELKLIDLTKKEFTCGGRTFYIQDSLSFNRYRELQRLSIEFGFSRTFVDLWKALDKAEDYMNKVQFVDAAVELRNAKIGIGNLVEKDDPALRLCALFMNERDEDITVIDDTKIQDKLDCWGKELDVTPFFNWAAALVKGWMPVYLSTTQATLEKGKKPQ